jgi:hypothetical protein
MDERAAGKFRLQYISLPLPGRRQQSGRNVKERAWL